MRLLVLGGTQFVGRHIVATSLARGHEVTIFNRGLTNPKLFESVERLHGDRNSSELGELSHGEWDAVIDVSATIPRMVRETAQILSGRVGIYAFISTVSTYKDLDVDRVDEDAPLAVLDDPTTEIVNAKTYGGLKAGCEEEIRKIFGDKVLIIRAGTMAGPHDDTDRFTYWVRRLSRGGRVLGPARPDQPVQIMHARDHAEFLINLVSTSTTGLFNAVGPSTTFSDMVKACSSAAGTTPDIVWASQSFLDENRIRFPLDILSSARSDGIFRVSNERALKAGLVNRPLVDTASTVLRWDRRRPQGRLKVQRGLSMEREEELLGRLPKGPPPKRTRFSPFGLPELRVDQSTTDEIPLTSCLVVTTPRTGSWLLSDLLVGTGLAGEPQEYFRQDFVNTLSKKYDLGPPEITAKYINTIIGSSTAPSGIFSAKIQPHDFTRLLAGIRAIPGTDPEESNGALIERWFPHPRYVHLTRRDTGRQAISWYRALLSNTWWAFRDDDQKTSKPRSLDYLQIKWLEDLLQQNEADWTSYFSDHGISPYEVVYEELVESSNEIIPSILSFLGVDLPSDFSIPDTRLRKMADEETDIWLREYHEIRNSLPSIPQGWFWSVDRQAFIAPEIS